MQNHALKKNQGSYAGYVVRTERDNPRCDVNRLRADLQTVTAEGVELRQRQRGATSERVENNVLVDHMAVEVSCVNLTPHSQKRRRDDASSGEYSSAGVNFRSSWC